MRILVTGANGQLGLTFKSLKENYLQYQFYFEAKETLSILDKKAVETYVINNKIEVIINCAAYTNVNKAEEELEKVIAINATAVKYISEIAKGYNIKFIHFSTDYVFDGNKKTPYTELDSTNPLNAYGKSKLIGEQYLLEIQPKESIIIRTSWLYSEYQSNFVKTIIKLSKEKKEVKVVTDQVGTPTYARDLVETVLLMLPKLKNSYPKVYHYSNKGKCSWFQFAEEIIRLQKQSTKVLPINYMSLKDKINRPKYSVLSKNKIKNAFNIEIPNWQASLQRCLLHLS